MALVREARQLLEQPEPENVERAKSALGYDAELVPDWDAVAARVMTAGGPDVLQIAGGDALSAAAVVFCSPEESGLRASDCLTFRAREGRWSLTAVGLGDDADTKMALCARLQRILAEIAEGGRE